MQLQQALPDPLFSWANYWSLPCTLIDSVAKELTTQIKDTANRSSLTTAYLLDTIQGIVSQVWGKGEYESAPGKYLPYPPPKSDDDAQSIDIPSIETLKILFKAIESGDIPNTVVAHLSPLLPDWQKLIKK